GHNIIKNRHQRIVVERLQQFATQIGQDGGKSALAAQLLEAASEVYNLSITLPDNTFVPLSMWTWTSYSYRGGLGTPTPLSSLVERDWATTDFLTEYITRAQMGNESTIYRKVIERIGEGREFEDISTALLDVPKETQSLVIRQTPSSRGVLARKLLRPVERAILEPDKNHEWENRYVLNAGAVRLDGKIYILYRAFGTDRISRIGLAWTRDGVHIDGRLDSPIFGPATDSESSGCEDPRITVIGDRMYMLYTAYDGDVAQIAMASIPTEAFLEHRFDRWTRHGLGFPGLANKDAVLYPEKFMDRYVIYHRLDPNLWVSYLDDLTCPWPRTGQKIIAGPRPGMMWDGVKIGAGAQPIKTTHGWLNIYHGVDYERCYRLGVLFMALDDPARIIYQSPNAILEPELNFEIGNIEGRDYWVPKVVFTCGAVPREDKEIVGVDDEILVYYGAADTAIGVATGTLRDMVPILQPGQAERKKQ
ncbi:MAG: glycosidase, partial [Candidatus Latescibacterota bacterium]